MPITWTMARSSSFVTPLPLLGNEVPLMHLPERADHGEIIIEQVLASMASSPSKAPAPGRVFLKGTRELVGILEYTIHIFGAERGFPLLKACFKHVAIIPVPLRIITLQDRFPRYKAENSKVQRQEMVVNIN